MLCPIMAAGAAQTTQTQISHKAYAADLSKWRTEEGDGLKADEGFLSVAGLFWLKEGDSSMGSDASCAVRFPEDAPAIVGSIKRQGSKVTFTADPGVVATLKGQPVSSAEMVLDLDRVTVGALRFMAIQRGQRIGIRLWDRNCAGFKEFKGQKWYAPNMKYVIQAKFTPYSPPKRVGITNVLGDTSPVAIVGYAEFKLDGKTCRLDAQDQGGGLFINFRDLTTGKSTYPAGRFLNTPGPIDGTVILDFNRAINPPCAFTAFATCPLPPRQNYLDVAIPAGEKTHHPPGE